MKYGIFYGSQTGSTQSVAEKIALELNVAPQDIHNVAKTAPSILGAYDVLILGTSTWGDGEIEEDWYDFLDGATAMDLKGKKMAVFGCGDQTMSETFCNGVGELYSRMLPTGVTPIGAFSAQPFKFGHSDAIIDGKCVGLLTDEVNNADLTDSRVKEWVAQLKTEA